MTHIDISQSTFISSHVTPVRWVDMDAYRHVNNARYFDYMVEARAALFVPVLKSTNTHYILVSTGCEFKKPLVYPQQVLIKQYVNSMTRTTFTLHYSFHSADSPELIYAKGEGVLVCVDVVSGRPVEVPEEVKQLLQIKK